jgi:hypothetical protein
LVEWWNFCNGFYKLLLKIHGKCHHEAGSARVQVLVVIGVKGSPSQIYSKMIGMLEKRHFTKDPIDEWLRSFVVSANQ